MTDSVTIAAPRLLRGQHGWWYLAEKKLLLLNANAVDAGDGRLRPEIDQRLRAAGVNAPGPRPPYSLTVLTTTTCNLGCAYCFQNIEQDPAGGPRPPRIAGVLLQRETARRILEFVAGKMAEADLKELDVHLFGGEPLLNPDGCRDLLELAAGYGLVSAQMTTNGTLLTRELASELAGLGLGSVQITFDGNRSDHDQSRVRRSGGGTFDDILANVSAAAEVTGIRWNFRINVSRKNRAGLHEMIAQIAAGVDPTRCRIGFAIVNDVGIGFTSTVEPDPELVDDVVGWTTYASDLGFIISRPRPVQPCRTCTYRDGRLGAVANADGILYSCWETAGKPGWEVGTAEGGYRPAGEVNGRWVGCGYDARNSAPEAAVRFRDAVDTRVLDYLHTMGRLGLRTPAAQSAG
ncbi:MAG TPA: radical SAM protein [Candidatus Limnocylindrales bacterium]|nr:radical SAM protein [Candidatus Limnocylindrales bacterium]